MGEVTLNVALIVFITVAVMNRIKAEVPVLKSYWYTVISVGIGAALYAVALYAPPAVIGFICVGGAASGIFDVYSKTGTTSPSAIPVTVAPVIATPIVVNVPPVAGGPKEPIVVHIPPVINVVSKPK